MAERNAVASPEPEQQAFRTDDASDEENELPQVRFGKIHAGREFGEGSEKGDQVVAVIEAKPYDDGELHEPEMPNFHDSPRFADQQQLLDAELWFESLA